MATVRSDQLGDGLVLTTNATGSFFTVPAGETWLVKRMCSYAPVTAGNMYFLLEPTGGPTSFVVHKAVLSFGESEDADTWIACQPGSELVGFNEGVGTATAICFGAKLLGVA